MIIKLLNNIFKEKGFVLVDNYGKEYLIGKMLTTSNNPFQGTNLAIRAGGLPVAFGIGLAIVSSFT